MANQPPSQVNVQVSPGAAAVAAAQAAARGVTGEGVGVVRNIQVVSDKDNNTILIVATPAEYSIIEAALKKLDVPQRQVVIEATIAEVPVGAVKRTRTTPSAEIMALATPYAADARSISSSTTKFPMAPGTASGAAFFGGSPPQDASAASPAVRAMPSVARLDTDPIIVQVCRPLPIVFDISSKGVCL